MPKKSHGMSRTPEFKAWDAMIQRCENPKTKFFHNYGGRGVKVCDSWKGPNGFVTFLAEVGFRPSPKHSLDRRENSKGYEPGNVRWATRKEQNSNTRKNKFVTHNGRTLTISGWAREYGIHRTVLGCRLMLGWSFERAISEPVKGRGKNGRHSGGNGNAVLLSGTAAPDA